jgi:LysM domain
MSAMPAEIVPAEIKPAGIKPAETEPVAAQPAVRLVGPAERQVGTAERQAGTAERRVGTGERQVGARPRRSSSRPRSTGPRPRPAGVRACSAALRAEPIVALQPAPAAPPTRRAAESPRPHLTTRGRSALVAGAVIVATLLWFAVASATQGPARALPSGTGGQAPATQVVVQPGQTLWSIAVQADPSADPRLVVQQIVSMNSLSSENIAVGQHLRIPQG